MNTFGKNSVKLAVAFCTASFLLFNFQNCTPMTAMDSPNSNLPPGNNPIESFNGQTLYAQNCTACHGTVNNSTKLNRSAYLITTAISEVPQMRALAHLSAGQIAAIANALSTSSTPVVPPEAKSLFTCTPSNVPKTPLLRLTNREFKNSLNNVLDGFNSSLKNDSQLTQLLNNSPSDIVTQDRDTLKEQALLNSQPIFNNNFNIAFRAGALVSGHTTGLRDYPNTNQCLSSANINQACHTSFVNELTRRAFRRPLTQAEVNTTAALFWDTSLSKAQLIQVTVASILLMPEFLYKAYDRGVASSIASNTREMTAHELASKVSFFITGSPPDVTLRGHADSGQILNNSVLSNEIERLFALPAARNTIARLFRESFGYDVFDNFIYLQSYVNGVNTNGLQKAMSDELDDFFYNVIITQRGTFADLFTSTSTNVTHTGLASIYNVGMNATDLSRERAGFLSRAAMLTKRSGFNASPIKRGLKVLEHVLCEEVGLPPPSAPTALPVVTTPTSTRVRTEHTTEMQGSSCIGCHGRMNNLGYPFEQFDTLGRIRTQETIYNNNGDVNVRVGINTRASTLELSGRAISVADAADLNHEIGRSDKAMMCFMKNLKKFESRVANTPASNCHMNQGLSILYGENNSSGRVIDAIKSFILAPEFRRWSY